uniref:Ig-like domain-containing protein n=1 Tax=Sinocyclocheilus rhinocerous TaxID=307959 RepID=A0A673J6J8_9TELE
LHICYSLGNTFYYLYNIFLGVDQNTRVQTAVEGRSVTINCRYETKTSDLSPYLFWYQQKMNGIPKYMMMIFAITVQNDKDFEERFNANHNKSSKLFPLTIHVCVSDSAMYYCALRPTVTETFTQKYNSLILMKNVVEQNTTVQTAVEGAAVTINCQYETTDKLPNLLWCQQKANGVPEYMLSKFGSRNRFNERFSGDLNTISKTFPLTIQDVRVSNSSVYYCALRTNTQHSYKKPCMCNSVVLFNL